MTNPNKPHWTIYTCPQLDEPETLCQYRASSQNWDYIFARAQGLKVKEFEKRVFIRRTDVAPFNHEDRFLEDVCQLEVVSLFLFTGLEAVPELPEEENEEWPF